MAPVPNVARPIWLITVSCSDGMAPLIPARIETPMNISPTSAPMSARVVRALRASGRWNAGTPFETASTPVIALSGDRRGGDHRTPPASVAGLSDRSRTSVEVVDRADRDRGDADALAALEREGHAGRVGVGEADRRGILDERQGGQADAPGDVICDEGDGDVDLGEGSIGDRRGVEAGVEVGEGKDG